MNKIQFLRLLEDALRYFTIIHGVIFIVFALFIFLSYIKRLKNGYEAKFYIKYEIFSLISWSLSMLYLLYNVKRQLHQDFSWYLTPMVLICLIFADVSFYNLFKHRKSNKE